MLQPPSATRRRNRRATPNRTAEILTISVLVALFMLLGVGGMFWVVRNQIAFAPTATPTATATPLSTPTPNVPATLVMEDLLTQVAYTAAQATFAFQLLGGSQAATAQAILTTEGQPVSPLDQVANTVHLPNISAGGDAIATFDPVAAAQATASAQATTMIALPIVVGPLGESPIATPTATTLAGITVIETPSETATSAIPETPTLVPETPTETPIPTATPILVQIQNSKVFASGAAASASLYLGIGSRNTPIATVVANDTTLKIKGRNESGEWLLVCCVANADYWARSAYVRPSGNSTPPGAPDGSSGDDVRWLPWVPVTGNPILAATATPTAIPANDTTQALQDLRNSGLTAQLPSTYMSAVRFDASGATKVYVAPLMIANGKIYAANADGKLYALDRNGGNQQWNTNLDGQQVFMPPAVVDTTIYLASVNGVVFAVLDQGADNILWRRTLTGVPVSGIKAVGDKLFVGVLEGSNVYKLVALNRDNSAEPKVFTVGNSQILLPAIAGNLVFVAGDKLFALDVDDIAQVVWQIELKSLTPPLYVSPGQKSFAELFVVDAANGFVKVFNANTGEKVHEFGGAENSKYLIVNGGYVVAIGNSFVRSFQRSDGGQIQNIALDNSTVLFAALNNNRMVLAKENGTVLLIDFLTGAQTAVIPQPPTMLAAPVISGLDLVIPGSDNYLYIIKGIQ